MGRIFRTALFGGFRKKEVIEYLDGLSRERDREKEIHDEQIVKLEQTVVELKNKLSDTEKSQLGIISELENLRQTKDSLHEKIEAIDSSKDALLVELSRVQARCLELEQQNSALSSRVLDFDDERRSLEVDAEEQRKEFEENRRELESRIFDLEAEIVEGLEHRAASQSGTERAYRGVQEISGSIADIYGENEHLALQDLKVRLEDIIGEINRLVKCETPEPAKAARPVAVPVRPPVKRGDARLGSLGDILRHVRGNAGK